MSEEFHTTHFQVFIEDHLGLNLRDIDHVQIGTPTRWGVYEGLTMHDDQFFYAFQPDMSSNHENRILISTTAQVDPTAILEPGVHINEHAVVDEDEYVRANSEVYEETDVDPLFAELVDEAAEVQVISPFMDQMTLDSLQRVYGMQSSHKNPEFDVVDEVEVVDEHSDAETIPIRERPQRHFVAEYQRPPQNYRRSP